MSGPTVSGGSIKTTRTVFAIIEALRDEEGLGVTELADRLGFAKSTVHDHVMTLVREGYLVERGTGYQLSLKFLDHGTHVRDLHALSTVAQETVDRLAEQTNEIVWLFVEERGWAVLLYKQQGRDAVDIFDQIARIGQHNRLHDHAGGKAILAHLSDERIEELIEKRGLPDWTQHTITDRDRLWEEIEEIRTNSVAYSYGELIVGGREVGAPISVDDELVGSISISGPAGRLTDDVIEDELVPLIRGSSNEVELNLLEEHS